MSPVPINPSLPVVVLGFGYGGLGIARSLGRLGVRVHAVHADPAAAGLASRYVRSAHAWDFAGASVTDTLCFLDDLGSRLGPALLLPTTDATAILVAEHSDELAPRFLFPRPPRALVRRLADKREVFRLAGEFGVPTPLTAFPRSRDDVERFLADARFPVVLKPIDRTRFERRTSGRIPPVAILTTPDALLSRYREWEDRAAPNLMVQEHIPGGDDAVWMFNGVFNEWSECVAAFTGRKLRQDPWYGGTTSLGVCERNDRVERLTIDFMWALRYQGMLDVHYRYDARDDLYKLLDPKPRVGAAFRLFVDEQGLDVVRVLYCDLTRQPVWPARVRDGRKWLLEDQDLEWSLARVHEGSLTLRRWLASLAGVEEAAWFARDDLRPFLRVAGRLLARAVRAVGRRLAAAIRAAGRGTPQPRPAH
jgi:predicted ATP-grasp superfamily ATP-dependent carboligase